MISRARSLAPECERVVDCASEVLGRDLGEHYGAAEETSLVQNSDVQIGVFLANHLHLTALHTYGGRGDRSLGLSLGEYNHLVHIGALSFEDALQLVAIRGALYDVGPRGLMASVFPLTLDNLNAVLAESRSKGVIEIGNFNSPSQHVVTGDEAAVRFALEIVERDHFAQGVIIDERTPMHSSLFQSVAEKLRPYLERAAWRRPSAPYLPNVTATPIAEPTSEDFIRCLTEHVHRPVLWRESIEHLVLQHPNAVFAEIGPRAVLFNLLQKRWLTNRKLKTDDPEEPIAGMRATAEELRDVA